MQTVLFSNNQPRLPPLADSDVSEKTLQSIGLPDFDLHMVERALKDGHLYGCRQLTDDEVREGVAGYREFMREMKANGMPKEFPFPGSLVDRVWHTHIAESVQYREDCVRYFGKVLEHSFGICDGSGAGQP